MSSNVVNHSPYLRTSRNFPEDDAHQMAVEVNKSYVDIASKVNNRTIGLYPTTRPAINGESWFFLQNKRQQGFRQIYELDATIVDMSTIDIGFKILEISQISPRSYGSFTDGTEWYGLIYGSSGLIPNQISFWIHIDAGSTTTDQIQFRVDAGAPAITAGTLVLEWLSQV